MTARIVTPDIVERVDAYVRKALDDAKKYDNSTPLDESGIWSLHSLAAEIYAEGFEAGQRVEAARQHGVDMRARENRE